MTIHYLPGPFHPATLCRLRGTCLLRSLPFAFLCGALAFLLKTAAINHDGFFHQLETSSGAYNAVSVLVGFMVIFRTQQSYGRFWEGATYIRTMQAEIFTTGSNLVAFCRPSKRPREEVVEFQMVLVRLLSLLSAATMWQLRGGRLKSLSTEVIDLAGIDTDSLKVLANSDAKVQLLIQWIQSLTVDAEVSGVVAVAPPIVSRIYQNLSNALSAYYSATRLIEVQYPFAYAQTTDLLVLFHLIITPMAMCSFSTGAFACAAYSFLVAVMIVSLNHIAVEIENPFGPYDNNLSLALMQEELNQHLLLLVKGTTQNVPYISCAAVRIGDAPAERENSGTFNILKFERLSQTFEDDEQRLPPRREITRDSLQQPRTPKVHKTWTQVECAIRGTSRMALQNSQSCARLDEAERSATSSSKSAEDCESVEYPGCFDSSNKPTFSRSISRPSRDAPAGEVGGAAAFDDRPMFSRSISQPSRESPAYQVGGGAAFEDAAFEEGQPAAANRLNNPRDSWRQRLRFHAMGESISEVLPSKCFPPGFGRWP